MTAYYKYMERPTSKVNFGLSSEQEDRARKLHQDIIVFDGLMKCSWYDDLVTQLKRRGTTADSLSIGNTGYHRWQGRIENIDARLDDWWSAETLLADIGYVSHPG